MTRPSSAWHLAPLALGGVLAAIVACCGCTIGPDGHPKLKLPPTLDELTVMALDPNSPDRRREGITALSQHPRGLAPKVLPVYKVVASNTKEDPTVRVAALGALGRAGDAQYAPVLGSALDDPDASVRWEAAVALQNVSAPCAIEPLRKHALLDPLVDVRAASAKALGHYKRPDVIGTLVQCLRDADFTVRHHAHASLVHLTGLDPGFGPRDWSNLIASQPTTQDTKLDK